MVLGFAASCWILPVLSSFGSHQKTGSLTALVCQVFTFETHMWHLVDWLPPRYILSSIVAMSRDDSSGDCLVPDPRPVLIICADGSFLPTRVMLFGSKVG